MFESVRRENISIVLHRPRFSENIGAAARAMCNMGFDRLIIVEPQSVHERMNASSARGSPRAEVWQAVATRSLPLAKGVWGTGCSPESRSLPVGVFIPYLLTRSYPAFKFFNP